MLVQKRKLQRALDEQREQHRVALANERRQLELELEVARSTETRTTAALQRVGASPPLEIGNVIN